MGGSPGDISEESVTLEKHVIVQWVGNGTHTHNDNSSIFLTWLYSQGYNINVPSI